MFNHITINKNRGWRGLAEVKVIDLDTKEEMKMIFSFSEPVWRNMLDGRMVMQTKESYYVFYFDNLDMLPKSHQQRSVLIKNFNATITKVNVYPKTEWGTAEATDWMAIAHFRKNKNNHTTSDWNYIGIRVTPKI